MVEELNKNAVRITKVEGSGSIPMCLHRVNEFNPKGTNSGCNGIHIFGCSDNESNVMNVLNRARFEAFRELVNRKVIGAGGEIGIVRIGLPFHPHTQNGAVKIDGFTHVPDVDCDVPKT